MPFELAGIKSDLNQPALGMLTNQRRMHADICDIINRHFYENKLTTQVDSNRTRASSLPPLPGKPAVLVN
jgi:superfamily I DNA and/or RNA helicase